MTLKDWLSSGWAVEHVLSVKELRDFLGVFRRDLEKCELPGLGADWRMMIAYNAALQLASAALTVSGYRVRSESHHYRVIQSLKWTLDLNEKEVRHLEAFRKRRNISSYKKAHTVTEKEADAMVVLARRLHELLVARLAREVPELYGQAVEGV